RFTGRGGPGALRSRAAAPRAPRRSSVSPTGASISRRSRGATGSWQTARVAPGSRGRSGAAAPPLHESVPDTAGVCYEGPNPEESVPIELEVLKTERDRLKESLREIEADLRKLEADVKALRQREIQTKREIEALTTLVELKEGRERG